MGKDGKGKGKAKGNAYLELFAEGVDAKTFQVMEENKRSHETMEEFKAKFVTLQEDKLRLEAELKAEREESHTVMAHLQETLDVMSKDNARMKDKLAKVEMEYYLTLAQMTKGKEEEINALKEADQLARDDLNAEINHLRQQLELLVDFKVRQDEIEREVTKLASENEQLRLDNERELNEKEREYMDMNRTLKRDYEAKLQSLKRQTEEDIDERMDVSVKQVLHQNRVMAQELLIHVSELGGLQNKNKVLVSTVGDLNRELEMKATMEEEYNVRGAKQARQIKKLQGVIDELRGSIGEMEERFKKEAQSKSVAEDIRLQKVETENQGLRRLVKIKSKELKNVRLLARDVLDSRSEVETFLRESVQYVKAQIQRDGGDAPSTAASTRLPSLSQAGSAPPSRASAGQLGGDAQGDVGKMSWADRERVLRLLFAKMNAGRDKARMNSAASSPSIQASPSGSPKRVMALSDAEGLAGEDELWELGGSLLSKAGPAAFV